MKQYIVLLRGVMPTGKNKVPMAQLRQVLEAGGFRNVRTYIQTGNVLVDSEYTAAEIEQQAHDLIREEIGPDLAVVVRTADQLQKVLDNNPFQNGNDVSRMFFALLAQQPEAEKVEALLAQDFGEEELVIAADIEVAYMYIPGAYGRGKLSNNFLEKKLGVAATMRNFNTLSKLIEMSSAG